MHNIWVASTDDAVCFSISHCHNRLAFHDFLGEAPYGMTTDQKEISALRGFGAKRALGYKVF